MGLEIKKIEINNFKVFTNKVIDFEDSTFIVLDGPNGFGKTSLYDAIELLFMGKIRRYNSLFDNVMDGRFTFEENPYLNNLNKSGDLFIKCHLLVDGQEKFLMRRAGRKHLNQITKIKDIKFDLYELETFKKNSGKKIKNEEEYLSLMLGIDYLNNFKHLNYIEQEENSNYLKQKDSERSKAISYLFNTKKFEDKIKKLVAAKAIIANLCGKAEKGELVQNKIKIETSKKEVISDYTEQKYCQIIDWKQNKWDKENINFSLMTFPFLLGEEGVLEKIKSLVTYKEDFYNDLKNKKIKQILSEEKALKDLILYSFFLENHNKYKKLNKVNEEINNFLNISEKITIESFLKENFILTENLRGILDKKLNLEEYDKKRNSIFKKIENLNEFQLIVINLKESRNNFIKKYNGYVKETNDSGNCPLCGYDWEKVNEFNTEVEKQTVELEKQWKLKGSEITEEIDRFYKENLEVIKKVLYDYKTIIKFDSDFFKDFDEFYNSSRKTKVTEINIKLKALNIEWKRFLNKEFKETNFNNLIELRIYIEEKKEIVDEKNINSYFEDIFINEFNSKKENLEKITLQILEEKIKYVKYRFGIFQNETIKKMEAEYNRNEEIYKNALKMKSQIESVMIIYKKSLKNYQKEVIANIEILFHIYSGRIVQDFQGGLGLFIMNDHGIRFVESPKKSYDAVFNMSSGQLASLVISFTLALNKMYSQNKLILIDDPVQTLDELNVASFIDVLRNDFSDRQILISTHEDMMSAFMRYKFNKFGIKTKRINFKEI